MPYEVSHPGCSTFTIADKDDAFTKFLTRFGNIRGDLLGKCPVYHIKVVVSKKGLLSKFYLDPIQVKKVSNAVFRGL
jgi:hypothetical protein